MTKEGKYSFEVGIYLKEEMTHFELQVGLEKELNKSITELQSIVAPHPPIRHSLLEDESGMLHELTQVFNVHFLLTFLIGIWWPLGLGCFEC